MDSSDIENTISIVFLDDYTEIFLDTVLSEYINCCVDTLISPDIKSTVVSKAKGLTYICPLSKKYGVDGTDHPINNSRLKQHVIQSHRHLITEYRSVNDMILEIKLHSQNLTDSVVATSKEECPKCGLFFKRGKCMSSHMTIKHGVDLNKKKLHTAIEKMISERDCDVLDEMFTEFWSYLEAWDGKGLSPVTAASYLPPLRKLYTFCMIYDFYDILQPTCFTCIASFIQEEAQRIECGSSKYIAALVHLGSFLTSRKSVDIESLGLNFKLIAFKDRINSLRQTYDRKIKRKIESRRKEELEQKLLSHDQVNFLHGLIEDAISDAKSNTGNLEISFVLGMAFSFYDGNAHRPDVATNVTIKEFVEWSRNPDKNELLVHKHKTASIYGPARVATNSTKDILMKYGCSRQESTESVDDNLLDFQNGFGSAFYQYKKQFPSLQSVTNTSYRSYIETNSKIHLSIEEQNNVSERLLHTTPVARQSYMAIPRTQSLAARASILSLLSKTTDTTDCTLLSSEDSCKFIKPSSKESCSKNVVSETLCPKKELKKSSNKRFCSKSVVSETPVPKKRTQKESELNSEMINELASFFKVEILAKAIPNSRRIDVFCKGKNVISESVLNYFTELYKI